MIKCDVHVLKTEKNKQYWDECFQSLANEPINIHVLSGIDGHIGKGRYAGYQMGDCEYVSYVDDDDYIEPGIFAECINFLDNNSDYAGVGSKEAVINGPKINPIYIRFDETRPISSAKQLHHIMMFRRSVIEKHLPILLEYGIRADICLRCSVAVDNKIGLVDKVGYYWRQHEHNVHRNNEYDEKAKTFIDQCELNVNSSLV